MQNRLNCTKLGVLIKKTFFSPKDRNVFVDMAWHINDYNLLFIHKKNGLRF